MSLMVLVQTLWR